MYRTEKNVTVIETECVLFEDGPECPMCGRPRVWRRTGDGSMMCGTGDDAGRIMDTSENCWACRESIARW